jgi:hypothetical protein
VPTLLLLAWWWWPILAWVTIGALSFVGFVAIALLDKLKAWTAPESNPRSTGGDLLDDLAARISGEQQEEPAGQAHRAGTRQT